ncbi:hypothetical protein GYA54_01510 [Candidatus Kuenenbacteria bacterium]|mgnify:CR=1 FL=1|nr:hypothetical protein [Candidatus Kuenenbacteria bacterium]
MPEKFEGATPPQESKENQGEQFESAIRKFFREQWPDNPETKKQGYGFDFDISDPKIDDMKRVQSGDFEISHFQTSPTSDPEKLSFHFYVGGTEFHIQGKAADRIYELMEE